jgi:hypothetical protein
MAREPEGKLERLAFQDSSHGRMRQGAQLSCLGQNGIRGTEREIWSIGGGSIRLDSRELHHSATSAMSFPKSTGGAVLGSSERNVFVPDRARSDQEFVGILLRKTQFRNEGKEVTTYRDQI